MGKDEKSEHEKEAFVPGLTNVSALAVLFGLIAIAPVMIYLGWAVGPVGGERFIPVFVTILLFTEVGRLMKRRLTSQEAYIIYFVLHAVGSSFIGGAMFGDLLLRYYYRSAPYTILFGIADKLPLWYVPALGSYGPLHRTFLSPEWLTPIAISVIISICITMIDYGVSFITNMLYIEVEKLPFPIAPVDYQAISTLTERTPEKVMYFSFAAITSLIYEFVVYGIPNLTNTFLNVPITIIPYPWVDFTSAIELVLPGAVFAIGTDISLYMTGWLIPFNAAVWMFIGSLAVWVFGNALALRIDHSYFRMWQRDWVYGGSIGWWWQRAIYDLWASPQIGLTLGIVIGILVIGFRAIKGAIFSLRHLSKEQLKASYLPFRWIMALITAGAIGGMLISISLLPELWFVWIITWTLVPFVQGLLTARGVAEIGLGITLPYIREAFFFSFTKPGDVIPWAIPSPTTSDAGIITHRVYVAKLLKVRPLDYYKAAILFLAIAIALSFIYISIFWSITPIPSAFYPYMNYSWPISALYYSLWVSRSVDIFKVDAIAFTSIISFATIILSSRLSVQYFSPIGFLYGFQNIPPYTLPPLIGALIGKQLEKKMGKERWEVMRGVLLAGVFCGMALAMAATVAITMMGRAVTTTPF